MRLLRFVALFVFCASSVAFAAKLHDGALRIFAIDVEGGQATLFVSPTGQSLLVDTGWGGHNGRDADRIVEAAKEAGLSRIDTVLITHYHDDHVTGLQQLMARIPVGTFYDHGAVYEKSAHIDELYAQYLSVSKGHKRVSPRAGEALNLSGFDALAISSDGVVMKKALPGAGKPNSLCKDLPSLSADTTENGHSLGIVIRFAGINILDAGDLTMDRERDLICPSNLIGHADVVIVSHHGSDLSSSRVFVHSLTPRVAVMDNGDTKGGSTSVLDTYRSSPGLVALYQLHTAPVAGSPQPGGTAQQGAEHNVPPALIANISGVEGKRIDIDVNADGSIDIENRRTGTQKHLTHN